MLFRRLYFVIRCILFHQNYKMRDELSDEYKNRQTFLNIQVWQCQYCFRYKKVDKFSRNCVLFKVSALVAVINQIGREYKKIMVNNECHVNNICF